MRRTLICAVALLVLGACHGGGGGIGYTIYANQKNETLTLEYKRSVYNHLYNVTHKDLNLNGGTYTLKTSEGTTSGTFTRSVRGQKVGLVFQPGEGKVWGVDVGSDGSFTDVRGSWKQSIGRVAAKAPAVVKVGP
jgi:hypothetical protein